ncbi:MAG: Ig-like domain-containing protein, partial [Methanomassiliicoccaceae archaeon]|nr:Ig-like domain-containing protein [Methanomassiliicoccaceae archaeon]
KALEKACADNGIPLMLVTTQDGNSNSLKGWIGNLFGLGDESRGDGIWTYWAQYKDGNYNQFTLGYYTDGGNFQITRLTSTEDGSVVPYVKGVAMGSATLTMGTGDVSALTYTLNPANAYYTEVSWTSSNPSVATVDGTGKVTALSAGTSVITVKTKDGGYTATCTVTVGGGATTPTPPGGTDVSVTGVAVDRATASVTAGGTVQINAAVSPDNATNKGVTWSSSDTSVATVSGNGLVTALKAGTAVITVRTGDGGYTAMCTVTVKASAEITIDPEVTDTGAGTTATVTDRQMDDANEQAKDTDGGATPVLSIDAESKSSRTSGKTSVLVPAAGLKEFAAAGGEAKISTSSGTVVLDNNALKEITKAPGETVEIIVEIVDGSVLNAAQKAKAEDGLIVSVTVKVGGAVVSQLNGSATVTIPYELKAGQDPSKLVVWYLDDNGGVTEYPCTYDPVNKAVTFVTDHFSYYVVVYTGTDQSAAGSDGESMTLYIAIAALVLVALCAGALFYVRSKKASRA